MRGPVVLNHSGMVDRNVGRALIEIGYRIAASLHQRRHQIIRFYDRALRGVDKARLYGRPLFRKALALGRIEIANVELLYALRAIG